MPFSLLPREEEFFDLFVEVALRSHEAAGHDRALPRQVNHHAHSPAPCASVRLRVCASVFTRTSPTRTPGSTHTRRQPPSQSRSQGTGTPAASRFVVLQPQSRQAVPCMTSKCFGVSSGMLWSLREAICDRPEPEAAAP